MNIFLLKLAVAVIPLILLITAGATISSLRHWCASPPASLAAKEAAIVTTRFLGKVLVMAVVALAVAIFATCFSSRKERQAAIAGQVAYRVPPACYHDALNNLFTH